MSEQLHNERVHFVPPLTVLLFFHDTYISRNGPFFTEGETGLQWLPLQVPANVRIIVTATLPGLNYLQLQEQKLHRVASKPHQEGPSTSSQSQSRGGDDDDAAGTTPIPGRSTTNIEGIEGIENTSNHHRRKVALT